MVVTGGGGAAAAGGPQTLSRSGSLPACSEMRRTRTGPSPFELASRPNTIPKAGHSRSKRQGVDSLSKRPPSAGYRPPSADRRAGSRPSSSKQKKFSDPPLQPGQKLPATLGLDGDGVGAVHVFGEWTALEDPELGLVFVHTSSGRVQTTPPPEVLAFIQGEDTRASQDTQSLDQEPGKTTKSEAQYQRIFMSTKNDVPQLLMAKDMVLALRQGSTPFQAIQQRFSDTREEGLLSTQQCSSKELKTCAQSLRIGQVSDPVVDRAGVHILMRVF